ncbi:MAG: AraC family transcriptional regulator [Pseudomonadota bacterium]
MSDRLVWLLNRFELRAKVFQAGPLSCNAQAPVYPAAGLLHILRAGSVRLVSEDGTELEIHEPSAFFYMNPTQHRIEPLDDEVSIICSTFEFGIGEGNPLQSALPELFVLRLKDAPTLALTLEQLFGEAAEEHCGRDAILDRLSEVALILILRDLMDERRLDIGLLAGLADPKLKRAINAIHERPDHNWTLDRMAEQALMSRARFAERFHEVVGMTPGAYLSDWRLGLAKSMLLKGASVQTVACDVGYGSASALSRVFSSRCGMSPTEWRRTARH